MTDKPVFLWWAHKELWNTIAKNPGIGKRIAFNFLQRKYGKKTFGKMPRSTCFACQSVGALLYISDYVHCYECCPLDWGHESCIDSGAAYDKWVLAMLREDDISVAKYAASIRDLPLRKNAYELYDIKESPNE